MNGAQRMQQSREIRLRSLLAGSVVIVVSALILSASTAAIDPATPGPIEESTPVSQATTDDVVFGLLEWGSDDSGYFVVLVEVRNEGDLPVRFEPGLVILAVEAPGSPVSSRELLRSDPSLPCTLPPDERALFRLSFDLDPSEAPANVTIGIIETNRTGAKVIFPLQTGAGASAIGGSGVPGASATGTPASGPGTQPAEIQPPASPEAGGCHH
jgi:hypothetical protein